jgi:CRISPR-associated protein Cas2
MKMFLVAYDIADQKRLRKVAKLVYSHAVCGQKSVLQAYFSKKDLESFIGELLKITKEEDKINIIPLQSEPLSFNSKEDCVSYEEGAVIT